MTLAEMIRRGKKDLHDAYDAGVSGDDKYFLNTSRIDSHAYMFYGGARIDLLDKFDFSNVVDPARMFHSANTLKTIPVLGTKDAQDFTMFAYSTDELETIEGIDFSSATKAPSAFLRCTRLKHITVYGTIPISISWSSCPLTLTTAVSIINALKNYAGTANEGTYSITFSSTTQAYLNAAGAKFNGMDWKTYMTSIGWVY